MADRLFCIDFGSAYTKVSLRRGRRTNSEVVPCADHAADELKICVPSAVVVDSSSGSPRYTFGLATERRRSDGAIQVHRNWKRGLFLPPADGATPTAPATRKMTRLEALIHSKEFRLLAERHQIAPAELNSLRALVIHATSLTMPIYPTAKATSPADAAQQLATEFFTWLRRVVLDACAALRPAVPKPDEIPVRVTVPAFAPEGDLARHPGCVRLAAALQQANWKLDPQISFISEPYSNTIGALTQSSNCTRIADMFRKGLLITALSDPSHHPKYRVVVIDVGAFTTDLAVLTLDTGGHNILMSEIEFDRKTTSVPVGMTDLDEAILEALTPENRRYMRDEAPIADWARLRREVYLRRRPFSSPVGDIGTADERPGIDLAFETFHARLTDATVKFFEPHGDIPFKELVLTGGGCMFPTIQDALIGAAECGRQMFRKVHLPALPGGVPQRESCNLQLVEPLRGELARGGSALGGASAYFDMIS